MMQWFQQGISFCRIFTRKNLDAIFYSKKGDGISTKKL
jgi:hypothetical protein